MRFHNAYWAEVRDVTTKNRRVAKGDIRRNYAAAATSSAEEELKGIQSYFSGLFVIQNSSRQALIVAVSSFDLQGLATTFDELRAKSETR